MDQNTIEILAVAAVAAVIIGAFVLKRLSNKGVDKLYDSIQNKKARREAENPPQATKLSDIYGQNTGAPPVQPPQQSNPATVFCSSCGNQLQSGARFCDKCGSEIAGGTPIQPQYQQPVGASSPRALVYPAPVSLKGAKLSVSENSKMPLAAGICMAAHLLLTLFAFFTHRLFAPTIYLLVFGVSAVLFILFIFTSAKKNAKLFAIPLLIGVIFGILYRLSLYRFSGFLPVICFAGLLIVFCLTVFGVLKNKWIFISLCAIAVILYIYELFSPYPPELKPIIFAQALYYTAFLLLGLGLKGEPQKLDA